MGKWTVTMENGKQVIWEDPIHPSDFKTIKSLERMPEERLPSVVEEIPINWENQDGQGTKRCPISEVDRPLSICIGCGRFRGFNNKEVGVWGMTPSIIKNHIDEPVFMTTVRCRRP